jgi:hypothetical protein
MPIEAGSHIRGVFLQTHPHRKEWWPGTELNRRRFIWVLAQQWEEHRFAHLTSRRNTHLEFAPSGSFPWPLS